MINLILLKELEACRDLNEAYEFLKSRGINCTKADLLNLKNEYNNKFNNENTLTIKQLNNVAGGLKLVRIHKKGNWELVSDNTFVKKFGKEYMQGIEEKYMEQGKVVLFGCGELVQCEDIKTVNINNIFKNKRLLSYLNPSEIANMTEDEKKLVNTMQKSKDNLTLSAQIGAIGLFVAEIATACVFICSSSNNNNLNNNK